MSRAPEGKEDESTEPRERTMINEDELARLPGAVVHDSAGERIGRAGQVFLDDATSEPSWVTVNTGLFGRSESFVPIADADYDSATERIDARCLKEQVKGAPQVDAGGHLAPSQEHELYRYYGLKDPGPHEDPDRGGRPDQDEGLHHGEGSDGNAIHHGQPVAGGVARLRKHVVTGVDWADPGR